MARKGGQNPWGNEIVSQSKPMPLFYYAFIFIAIIAIITTFYSPPLTNHPLTVWLPRNFVEFFNLMFAAFFFF